MYFCCLEALQNAARHAGDGARVTVRAWREQHAVCFEVVDDGAGFNPSEKQHGAGLTTMTDRLGGVGGRLMICSEPGRGARVSGLIPVT